MGSPQVGDEEQEHAEFLVKRYTRNAWKRVNADTKDRLHRWRHKMAAVGALPTDALRTEALLVTDPTFPLHERRPTMFPPDQGWHREGRESMAVDELQDTTYTRMKREHEELFGGNLEEAEDVDDSPAPRKKKKKGPQRGKKQMKPQMKPQKKKK